ncbi:MAG: lipoprotein insertase outer membrane protein LolB [Woeseiaceae bacterium]|nr:lipoprotein insertase outer membrane protein LolB [Woeseiaceae bacterium]
MFSRNSTRGLLLALAMLGGCATPRGEQLPDLSDWDFRSRVLAEIDEFEFVGRIAVQAAGDGFNGKLRWYQDQAQFRASLSGPLGIGTVRIEGDGDVVEITDKDGATTVLADVEQDLYYRYGWTIPVQSLRFWALGIPDPRVPAETVFNDEGELTQLVQRGWTVAASRYRDVGGGQPMPQRLVAENADTEVRLVIDRWVFRETVALW